MSYLEPGYHKPGDLPFSFPPQGSDSKTETNLVEIEGRNGTGKTTLLNCLALALGYLDQEKELERKPILKRKLQDFDENKTLEYYFRVYCDKPEPIDLIMQRTKGQKPQYFLNSKPISVETIDKKFEVVFLTEDDPKKVVSASLGKLSKYFYDLEKGLVSLQSEINKHLMDIDEFYNFKRKEKEMTQEIEKLEQTIKKAKQRQVELQEKLKKVELKEQIKKKLELLSQEYEITAEYKALGKRYDQLKGKTGADIVAKLTKERWNFKLANEKLKEVDSRIIQICSSLSSYGISIQSEKLLENDWSELNELNRKVQPQEQKKAVELRIVEDMIDFFQKYPANDMVPLIDKPVNEVLRDLRAIKVKLASDRVLILLNTLKNVMNERKKMIAEIDKIQEKIHELSQKNEALREFDDVQKSFLDVQKRYIDLQVALQENRNELLSKWGELAGVEGTPEDIQKELQELEISIRTDETLITKTQENLNLHRENAARKPKYEGKEKELKDLYETISRLRENIFQWIQILQNPSQAREQFASLEKRPGFGLNDYEKFVKDVGEYLGNQFEPVAFDCRLHEIQFFDIEKNVFITKENRQIPIDKLSQGQSKITTLTGVFKKMDPHRKKIVLVDEIADLDPENLQMLKNNLREEYNKGSVLLAVIVRPTQNSSKSVEIKGWC